MPQTQPLIRLANVDVDIEGHRILSDISLQIVPGENWGIVGANGSGKSTLLALIAGKRWPRPGRGSRIYDFGHGPERDAVTARTQVTLLGHELQDLYVARGWNFRARDIVHSGLTRSDIPRRNPSPESLAQAQSLLEEMRLAHLADRRLLELSRGEQRRVLIARALGFDPALLLLDEPASGLDAESRVALEAMLERVAQKTQLVIAAHDTADLPRLVSRLVTVRDGRCEIGRLNGLRQPVREPRNPAIDVPSVPTTAGGNGHAASGCGAVMIALDRVGVWLDRRRVLRDLSWRIRAGENWLVTGPNGAGKSTLLRLLNAEIRPAIGGRISWPVAGNTENVWQLRRHVAIVSPELAARYRFPATVFEAVASGFTASIGLTRRLTSAESDHVDALLAAFDLARFRDRSLATLSYGQRQRTLITRTLASRPRLLLLDEPWEGLDSSSIDLIGRQLTQAMERGLQVVCVSHIGPRGLPLNRCLRLHAGRIVSDGDSLEPPENSPSAPRPVSGSRSR